MNITTNLRVTPINPPTTSLVHGLVSSVPHTDRAKRGPWHRPKLRAMPGVFHLPSTKAEIDPQMSLHMRVLSFGELKSLKHIGWNKEYIAQRRRVVSRPNSPRRFARVAH